MSTAGRAHGGVCAAALSAVASIWLASAAPAEPEPSGAAPAATRGAAEEAVAAGQPEAAAGGSSAPAAESVDDYDPLFDDEVEFDVPSGFPDPLEKSNRAILRFNAGADRVLLDPLTRAYGWVVPAAVRRALRRALLNADSVSILLNDMLQLEFKDAAVTTVAFVVNSTLGLAGLFDPASKLGFARHHSDFGQTLALSGSPSGPYLILPLLGPTNARDGIGLLVDTAANPVIWVLGPFTFGHLIFAGSSGISLRDQAFRDLKALEASSIDFYAALRSAFYQNRTSEIWSRREPRQFAPPPHPDERGPIERHDPPDPADAEDSPGAPVDR